MNGLYSELDNYRERIADLRKSLGETVRGLPPEALGVLSEADLAGTHQVEGRTVPVRWALMHLVDHTALHLGRMQITRQLWFGGESQPSRMWFQRLPGRQDQAAR